MKFIKDRKIKFAVVGCGHIGLRHAEMIIRNDNTELVSLIDVKPNKELNLNKYEVPFFNSLADFLKKDIEADIITIATPNGYHAKLAIQCLEAKHHVVIEKPIALTKADAESILFKSLNVSKRVFGVMQNRYSPPSVWLKSLIDKDILGKIYSVGTWAASATASNSIEVTGASATVEVYVSGHYTAGTFDGNLSCITLVNR